MGYRLIASCIGSVVLFGVGCSDDDDSTAPPPVHIAANAGNNQDTTVCAPVHTAPTVLVDRDGVPQAGISVTFTVTGGGGSVTGEHAVTDGGGIAKVGSWTLGADTGTNHLNATAEGTVFEFTARGHAEQVLRNVIIFTIAQPGFSSDVGVVRPDGSCQRLLTHDQHYAAPAISPDGKSIAVTQTYRGLPAIFVMKADGSGSTRIVGDSDYNMAPVWSPDGDSLAFAHWTQVSPTPIGAIYVIKKDGTGMRRVTPLATPPGDSPSWSPEGKKIAYWGTSGLHVINADGTGDTALVSGAAHPAWSPDSTRFAYDMTQSINVVNADGTNTAPVVSVTGSAQVGDPHWSPDSHLLVYFKVPGPPTRASLFIVGADGSNDHVLIGDGVVSLAWGKWSPLQ